MSALAAQKEHRARLIADASVIALVPAANIIDSSAALDRYPAIVIGEDQEVSLGDVPGVDRFSTVYTTFHIWKREPGLAGAKEIASAVRDCLAGATWTNSGWKCLRTAFESSRFIRDPDGETSHGIMTFKLTLQKVA